MKKSTKIALTVVACILAVLALLILLVIIETSGPGPVTAVKHTIYYNTIPSDEKELIDAYKEKYHQKYPYIDTLYGKFDNGAIVADIEPMGSHNSLTAITTEVVEDFIFYFSHVDRIDVFYNGEFYTLTYAYENGILSYEDLAQVHKIHNRK